MDFNTRAMNLEPRTPVKINCKNSTMHDMVGTIIDANGTNGRLRVKINEETTVQIKKKNVLIAQHVPIQSLVSQELIDVAKAATAGLDLPDAASPESAEMVKQILAADPTNPLAKRMLARLNDM